MKKKLFFLSMILFITPFCVVSQGIYQAYFGNLHSHTSNSDGAGEPEDAFNYARYTAGLDFLAVTDHLEQIGNIPYIDPEWSDCRNAADAATVNGTFVGIAGWEWGSPVHGHVNVFNTTDIIDDVVNLWYTTDLPAFYNWVLTHPPAFAQFNHPGEETYFTNWNNFAFVSNALDNIIPLIEFQSIQQANDFYEPALANGWHLSPVWNQDNHSADWGTKNDCRAGIWSTALTRPALFEAIMAGRTFASMDKNAKIWIDLSGTPMGSELPVQLTMPLHVYLSDVNNESWISIQLITQNGVLADIGPHSGTLDTTFIISPVNFNWIFVRALQADSNYLWSAPVFLTGTITHIQFPSSEAAFQLFPNPVRDHFYVTTGEDNSRIEIYNMSGRVLYSKLFQNKLQINTGQLSPGIYMVKITASDKVVIKKVLITG